MNIGELETPFVIGHRGAAGIAPENTLAAIRAALGQGAQAVEVDVQRSADGKLVVMHDRTVERTTDGQGAVGKLEWRQISQLDAGSWFSAEFAGERVPALGDVLQLVSEAGCWLLLEAKDPHLYPGIAAQIAAELTQYGLTGQVTVISFDHDWLARLHQEAPQVRLGYLWFRPRRAEYPPATTLLNLHWSSVLLNPLLVRRYHRQGLRVSVWTVNNVWLMRLLVWLGVDGITTDRPDLWKKIRGERTGDSSYSSQ